MSTVEKSVDMIAIDLEIEDNREKQYKTSQKMIECDRILSNINSMGDCQLDDNDRAAFRKLDKYRSKLSSKFIESQESIIHLYIKRNLVLLHEFKYE